MASSNYIAMDGPFYLHETVQAEAGTTIAYTLQDSAPRVLLRITATCTAIRRGVQRQQQAAQRMTAQTRDFSRLLREIRFKTNSIDEVKQQVP